MHPSATLFTGLAGRKRGEGCWTCRLRRKRCDAIRPVCGSCRSLEIACHHGEARPPWMDGGVRQQQMAESIQRAIKQQAVIRREQRLPGGEGRGTILVTESHPTSNVNDGPTLASPARHTGDGAAEDVRRAESDASTPSTDAVRSAAHWTATDASEELRSLSIATPISLSDSRSVEPATPIGSDFGAVMIYLDYVFPFLFPFYQPPLIQTGRQWLLGLLCQNDVSFHTAASLSAYFFVLVAYQGEQATHEDCKALVRDRLVTQMDLALRSIQNTLAMVNRQGERSPLLDQVRIMEEITQMLVVEVTVRGSLQWTTHLTPALTLFDEIFTRYGLDASGPHLHLLLASLPSSAPPDMPHHKPIPYTTDQSSLGFFVSLLLFVDIIASTSLGRAPTLQRYHTSLMPNAAPSHDMVRLEDFVGCQNWALVAVGDIAALCAWKREAKSRGAFSVLDLVNRAGHITRALDEGLASLDAHASQPPSSQRSARWLKGYYSRHDRAIDDESIATVTRIWAHAAKVYLSVGLSGWQTNATDSQASVTTILSLLQQITSPAQLRTLAWPIAVAGCCTTPSQEHEFHRIAQIMGPLGQLGTVFDALRIMQAVWSARNTLDCDNWDIASCLGILGSPALLL